MHEDASKKDLLNYMLAGIDKRTGQRLDDIQIRDETIIFLIAGHETTSGLLSFAIYALLNHPDVLAKAYEEVDRVLGPDTSAKPTYQQVNQLKYIGQILKETLRLWPTAPAFGIHAAGRHDARRPLPAEEELPLPGAGADAAPRPQACGDPTPRSSIPTTSAARPRRARPANAYKPFGNGQRACIGRQFALQEAALVLGMILQRFKLIDHKRYQLKIKEVAHHQARRLEDPGAPAHRSRADGQVLRADRGVHASQRCRAGRATRA